MESIYGKSLRPVVLKTRSSSTKDPKRTMPKAVHSSGGVPIERKENVCEAGNAHSVQPSCFNVLSVPRTKPKILFSSIKVKARKESTLKLKSNATIDKSKSSSNIRTIPSRSGTPKTSRVEAMKEKGDNDVSSRLKLHEICFLKGTEGKRMIAKYKGKHGGKKGSESDLIVEWDKRNTPQVFSHKVKGLGITSLSPLLGCNSGTNKGEFRVYNFTKSMSVKTKKIKRPLRRLTSATTDAIAKIDKLKKRKILKSQTTQNC